MFCEASQAGSGSDGRHEQLSTNETTNAGIFFDAEGNFVVDGSRNHCRCVAGRFSGLLAQRSAGQQLRRCNAQPSPQPA